MNNTVFNIDEKWFIATDIANTGREKGYPSRIADDATEAYVPSIIQQFFPGYHGVAYYWAKFTPTLTARETDRIILRFGGVDYKADVWLNGKFLGDYEGGETAFTFDVTDEVKIGEENLLAVRVQNLSNDLVEGLALNNCPHRNKNTKKRAGSHINHGGIWYGVSLFAVPSVYITDAYLTGDIKSGVLNAQITLCAKQECADTQVSVEVFENNDCAGKVASAVVTTSVKEGEVVIETQVTVPNFKLWDTDEPNLYRVEITVKTKAGEHKQFRKFGFREFLLKDGFFHLNGKKIFLKCAHSGNAFPIGIMHPVHIEQMRQDFVYAKASGFNMLRGIAGLFRPEQIDLADEMGMLIYDECFASWCLGNSHIEKWVGEEEFAQSQARHQSAPLGELQPMLKRWERATEQMLMRDRSHPSVVVWGLLNETLYNDVFLTAVDFLPRLRAVDQTRLVLLNAGRFDDDLSIGCSSNPYTCEWEKQLGAIETDDMHGFSARVLMGDNHFYPIAPYREDEVEIMRHMGEKHRPVFLSESGIGAQFNVIEEYKHFVQYGEREDLDDCSWLKKQSEDFTADFYRMGVDKVYPFPESLLKDSQRLNAEERKRFFDIVRSNPNFNGYSLTGLLDHGMCGEGLWSYWRRWKPQMFDIVSEGWAKLRFCCFATENIFVGSEAEFECVIASDGVLKSGEYNAHFAVMCDGEIVERFSAKFYHNESDFATAVIKRKIKAEKSGKYTVEAMLDEASPVANTVYFYAYDKPVFDKPVLCVGVEGIESQKCDGQTDGVVLVGKVSAEQTKDLLERAKEGATVIFLDGQEIENPENLEIINTLIPDLTVQNHRDWLYHKDYVLLDGEVFKGVGKGMMELTQYVKIFPHKSLHTKVTPDLVICPGFLTGYYGVEGAYASLYGMLGVKVGKGRVVLSTFELLENLGYPTAQVLIANLIDKFSK